jgi:hypothetical protein
MQGMHITVGEAGDSDAPWKKRKPATGKGRRHRNSENFIDPAER